MSTIYDTLLYNKAILGVRLRHQNMSCIYDYFEVSALDEQNKALIGSFSNGRKSSISFNDTTWSIHPHGNEFFVS